MQTNLTRKLLGAGILTAVAQTNLVYACDESNFRWAQSSGSLYVTGPVTCTLSDIASIGRPEALELVDSDNKVWMLRANLRLEDGARVNLHGDDEGGDVNELRLASPGSFGNISARADWGTIDIRSTRITSWNETTGQPDTDSSDGRAYIHVRSRLADDGTPEESRMDIINSEISYLGHNGAEAYGIAWKVLGNDFDAVDIYGDIKGSHIHHNYMGMYSYGAYGMEIMDNEVAYNESYGIDPHDDSDTLKIINNYAHDNGNHGIICSRRCDNLTIRGNTSVRNRHGIMLHRDTTDSVVEDNIVTDNRDTGIVLFESHRNVVRNNEVARNNHGIRLSLGSHDNLIENNLIKDNANYAFYFFHGSDTPESTNGRPSGNTFLNNQIENHDTAIKLTDADNNLFENNQFWNNNEFRFIRGINNELRHNAYNNRPNMRSEGDAEIATRTIIAPRQPVLVKLDDFSSATVRSYLNQVFLPEEKILSVMATPSETYINIDHALVGQKSEIQVLPLYVTPQNGEVIVDNPQWLAEAKQWEISATEANDVITYQIGELTPAATYAIVKNGAELFQVTSNAEGLLEFQDAAGSTDAVYYAIKPSSDSGNAEPDQNQGSDCSGTECDHTPEPVGTSPEPVSTSPDGVITGGGGIGLLLALLAATSSGRRRI